MRFNINPINYIVIDQIRLETKGSPQSINVKENRMNNQEWRIQRHWQHWVHKTHDDDKQNKKHNTEN